MSPSEIWKKDRLRGKDCRPPEMSPRHRYGSLPPLLFFDLIVDTRGIQKGEIFSMKISAIFLSLTLCFAFGCTNPSKVDQANAPADPNKKIKIGFAMATVKE